MQEFKLAGWFGEKEPNENDLKNIKWLGYQLVYIENGIKIFGLIKQVLKGNCEYTYSSMNSVFKKIGDIYNYQEIKAVFGDMPMVLYPLLNKRYSKCVPFFQKEDDIFLLSGYIPKGEQK